MCLSAPGHVVRIEGTRAIVDFFGVQREVCLDLVDEPVGPGDYVLVHVGFAIRRIPHDEVEQTLSFFAELGRTEADDPERDPLPRGVEDPRA